MRASWWGPAVSSNRQPGTWGLSLPPKSTWAPTLEQVRHVGMERTVGGPAPA